MTDVQVYDDEGHYLLRGNEGRDPAWPGITPEPQDMAVIFEEYGLIPVARSFLRDAEPHHYEQIRAMLKALPDRVLTQIGGYGDAFKGDWRAYNEGPDGRGDWTIHRETLTPEQVAIGERNIQIDLQSKVSFDGTLPQVLDFTGATWRAYDGGPAIGRQRHISPTAPEGADASYAVRLDQGVEFSTRNNFLTPDDAESLGNQLIAAARAVRERQQGRKPEDPADGALLGMWV